jgi:hypothetical protein
VFFLKPLKVLHTLYMDRLSGDGRRHEIECALGYTRKTRTPKEAFFT